jgi:hypothetical protein
VRKNIAPEEICISKAYRYLSGAVNVIQPVKQTGSHYSFSDTERAVAHYVLVPPHILNRTAFFSGLLQEDGHEYHRKLTFVRIVHEMVFGSHVMVENFEKAIVHFDETLLSEYFLFYNERVDVIDVRKHLCNNLVVLQA